MSDLSAVTRIVSVRAFYVPLTAAPPVKTLSGGRATFVPTLAIVSFEHDNVLDERTSPEWRFSKIGLSGNISGRVLVAPMEDFAQEQPEFAARLFKIVKAVHP